MENESLDKIWNMQDKNVSSFNAEDIIIKAKNQRKSQILGIIIKSLTVVILTAYTIYVLPNQWSDFSLGLILMITSLLFRVILEFISMYKRKADLFQWIINRITYILRDIISCV